MCRFSYPHTASGLPRNIVAAPARWKSESRREHLTGLLIRRGVRFVAWSR